MDASTTIEGPRRITRTAPRSGDARCDDWDASAAAASSLGPLLRSVAWRMLRDESAAEDAVQEAMIRARHAIGGLETETQVRAYLITVVRNVCRDELRRQRRRAAVARADLDGAVASVESAVDDRLLLDEILARLSAPERRLVVDRIRDGVPYAELAADLGVSSLAVRKRVHRALRRARLAVA